jgi:DeoR family transcriptional regulator of aga operon
MSDFIPTPERHRQILTLLERRRRLSVAEIVRRFSISEATARRDLQAITSDGKARRVHGGVLAVGSAPRELPILERGRQQSTEKARIGRLVASLIGDHETVFLGSGTTVLEVARHLRDRRDLTVITNSLPVLNMLAGNREVTVIALGGMLRDSELSLIGHIAELGLKEVRADKVVMGTRGVSLEHGLTSDYLPETLTDRLIFKIGRQVILVADHTKVNRVSTVRLAPLTGIHTFVTDTEASPKFTRALKRRGIKVMLA